MFFVTSVPSDVAGSLIRKEALNLGVILWLDLGTKSMIYD